MTSSKKFFAKLKLTLAMIKVSHTLFALPFALLAFALAAKETGRFSLALLFKIVLCVLWARACAMAFNRILDVRFDRKNPRTANRPLALGTLTNRYAVVFCGVTGLLFIVTAFAINRLCGWLALPTLAVLLFYSLTKRFTALSHFFLGLALALAPLGAFVAVSGQLRLHDFPLGMAVFFWVAGFDMIYALQDEAFDRKHGLHSMVVRLGRQGALWLARLCHSLTFTFLLAFGFLQPALGSAYFIGLCGVGGLLFAQHVLIRPDDQGLDLEKINLAFFRLNAIVSLSLLGATLIDLGSF